MSIVTLCSLKGGVGKTTSAVMISAVAAQRRRLPTLLVDADPQGSAAEWTEANPIDGVQVVEAPSTRLLERLGHPPSGADELIVIDTPPADVPPGLISAAIGLADAVIIPVRPGGLEPSRVIATLRLVPDNVPKGLVIVGARLNRNTTDTLDAWNKAGVPIWGVIPLRAAVEAGPASKSFDQSAILAYEAVLDHVLGAITVAA